MKDALNNLRRLMPFLPAGAKRYVIGYCITSSLLALLDVAALSLLALSITGMLSGDDLTLPIIGQVGPEAYLWVITIVAVLILGKSALQILQQWRVTRRYASFELAVGQRLFDTYMNTPWEERLEQTTARTLRMVDVGVATVNTGLLIPITGLPSMFATSILILVVLFVANPVTAAITIVYLGIIAFVLYFVLSGRTVQAGRVNRRYSFQVAELMQGMMGAMKEVTLRKKVPEVSDVLKQNRQRGTSARANINFLASVPKFVLDVALIGGFILIGGASFLVEGNMTAAFAAIAIFAVAGLRLIPALTTFQSANNVLSANAPQVDRVLTDLEKGNTVLARVEETGNEPVPAGATSVDLEGVTFSYPNADTPALADVTMRIPFGSSVGFVGASGSGKSTLVDILLGFLAPQEGDVRVGGTSISDCLDQWRESIGYVSQDVALFRGSVAQNVALTWGDNVDYDKVEECLRKAQLWETIQERPGGVNADVAERGAAFSGGQRQRFGIARALYTDPKILILDEATSALDTKTEAGIVESIEALHGELTVISVAHRLSTVRNVDQLCYFEAGHLLATGTFDEVVEEVPGFHEQAMLAGLLGSINPS